MTRLALAALILPLAFSARLPVAHRCAKGVSHEMCKAARTSMKYLKPPTKSSVTLPVHPSLRLVVTGSVGDKGTLWIKALSPVASAKLAAWYIKRLTPRGFAASHPAKDITNLVPKGADPQKAMFDGTPMVAIYPCDEGKLLGFACKTVVEMSYLPRGAKAAAKKPAKK